MVAGHPRNIRARQGTVLCVDTVSRRHHPRLTGLLAALGEVTPLSPSAVPAHSLIREFIGGSAYYEDNVVDPATTE